MSTFSGEDQDVTPTGMASDSTSIYWADSNWISGSSTISIKKVGKNGGVVTTLASESLSSCNVCGLMAVDSTSVYWVGSDSLSAAPAVKKVGINGGPVTTLATNINNFSKLIIDSTSIYWFNYDGAYYDLVKVGKNGGAVTTLVPNIRYYGLNFAVDSTSVYWIGNINRILRNGIADQTLNKIDKMGGTITTLATGMMDWGKNPEIDSTSVFVVFQDSQYVNNPSIVKFSINSLP